MTYLQQYDFKNYILLQIEQIHIADLNIGSQQTILIPELLSLFYKTITIWK